MVVGRSLASTSKFSDVVSNDIETFMAAQTAGITVGIWVWDEIKMGPRIGSILLPFLTFERRRIALFVSFSITFEF